MKEVNAVIGGEGNGGIIVPDFHYGRDALIGIGLFLSHLANHKKGLKSLRSLYPDYFISKNKIELNNGVDVKAIFEKIKKKYKKHPINTEDGLKIEFDNDWVISALQIQNLSSAFMPKVILKQRQIILQRGSCRILGSLCKVVFIYF